jgi:hypothetical protein
MLDAASIGFESLGVSFYKKPSRSVPVPLKTAERVAV